MNSLGYVHAITTWYSGDTRTGNILLNIPKAAVMASRGSSSSPGAAGRRPTFPSAMAGSPVIMNGDIISRHGWGCLCVAAISERLYGAFRFWGYPVLCASCPWKIKWIRKDGLGLYPGGVEKFAERQGVSTKSTHKMRKTYASNLNANGVPLDCIREMLGHSNLSTTLEYIYNPLTEKETYGLITKAL